MTQSGLPEPRGLISLKAQLQEQRMPIYKKLVRWTWGLLYAAIFGIAALFIVINFTGIPSFRELEDPKSKLASEVLANNNEVLGRFFIQNRVPATFNELSPWLEKALVSTEDERFYSHCGIDWSEPYCYKTKARVVAPQLPNNWPKCCILIANLKVWVLSKKHLRCSTANCGNG